jgi:cardiolipin synthase
MGSAPDSAPSDARCARSPRHGEAATRADLPAGAAGTPVQPSSAILTVPNVITFARLGFIPLFLWIALDLKNDGLAFVTGFVLGSTDFVDGLVARRFHQVSKLGATIDPLVDRFAVAAAASVLIARELAPLWAVVVVLARDALLLAAVPFLSARGIPRPPVSFAGKSGTMGIMWAMGLFIGAHATVPPSDWIRALAWIAYAGGIAFSYAAAGGYARDVTRALRGRVGERVNSTGHSPP